jgi:UDP-N-acetylglucosamine 2-epimerase (non-hydrolysing)
MNTVAVVYGTRPEAIKLAPVIVELRKIQTIRTIVICSGQHKEMLEGIMELWDLTPDFTLKYDFESGHTSAIPGLMIELEKKFTELAPDLVIVHGDTATATAAALQAHALHIPIGHVEAGLRSGDLWNPWPEEANRKVIDSIASLHFAPTKSSAKNLEKEGNKSSTSITGNTIVDALMHATKKIDDLPGIQTSLEELLGFSLLEKYIVCTQHRREAFGAGQSQVFRGVLDLAQKGHKVVFPVHLNPAVRTKVEEFLSNQENIFLIPPQNYLPFLELIRKCSLIISDSGGLQEEAQTFGKRILITRLTTERPEILQSGLGKLVGYDSEMITKYSLRELSNNRVKTVASNPFGNGNSAQLIVESVSRFLV